MKNEYTSMFIDRSCKFVYKYSFRCIVLPRQRAGPKRRGPKRRARPPAAAPRAPASPAPALAPSVRRARRGDVVGADRRVLAAIAGADASVGRGHHAAVGRDAGD